MTTNAMAKGDQATAHTANGPFVSDVPWNNLEPDCLVICCSDHRFEAQTRQLLQHLGFKRPHMLQVPSGPVLMLPLASAFNFLSNVIDKIVDKIVELQNVRTIICIGHHDCGAYKAGKVHLVNVVLKRITGGSVEELQHTHLAQAARRIKQTSRDVTVRAFFAAVVGEGPNSRVRFEEIPVK